MRLRVFLRQPLGVAGAVVLLVLAAAAATAPAWAPFDPAAIDLRALQRPPSAVHPFGTDDLGRDVLTRMLYAGRASLSLALWVTGVAVAIGATLGGVAGFAGGWVDRVISAATDALLAVPVLALAMVAGALLRPNLVTLTVVLAVLSWPDLARIARAQMLTLRERTYAEAATALGMRPRRVLFRHLLPGAIAPLVVAATLLTAQVLLVESALSFLGYGLRPPNPSWGGMLYEAQAHYRQSPWLAVFPGLAITLTVAAINFMGDALRRSLGGRGG